MIDVTRGLDAAQEAFADAERGVPNIGFAEVYFQTAYDPSVAPPGRHLVSVFAQYAPYTLAEGDWDSRREAIGRQILDAMAEFAPDLVIALNGRNAAMAVLADDPPAGR